MEKEGLYMSGENINTTIWISFLLLVALVTLMSTKHQRQEIASCSIDEPRHVVSGEIRVGSMFSPRGKAMYFITYQGTKRQTGEICEREMSVTEHRYDQLIRKE